MTGLVKEAMVTRSVPTRSEAVRRQSYIEKKSGNSYELKAIGNSKRKTGSGMRQNYFTVLCVVDKVTSVSEGQRSPKAQVINK